MPILPVVGGDSTAILQANLDAGGLVQLAACEYLIYRPLTLRSDTILRGAGKRTVITQTTAGQPAMAGTDVEGVTVTDVWIQTAPGGTAPGVDIGLAKTTCNPYLTFERITVDGFGGPGIRIASPIVTALTQVRVQRCGGGFHLHGVPSGACGTSTVLAACYANTVAAGSKAPGFWLADMAYTALYGCAVDKYQVGYRLVRCHAVHLSGCGVEQVAVGVDVDGGGLNLVDGLFGWQVADRLIGGDLPAVEVRGATIG